MTNQNKIKTIFIGTPDFAVPSLRALIKDEDFDVVAVITQPDKRVGRKQILTPPPVKVEAQKHNIVIHQPEKIFNLKYLILNLNPDIIIVIAYAQIIPESILEIPKYGVINIHGSLLPKYRGASCIQAAILNGDEKTGITIMKMDKTLDTGPILAQTEIGIALDDTAGSLYAKLSELGASILTSTLKKYIAGEIKPQPQDNSSASYVGLLKKEDGKIDWKKSAEEIEKHIRAMNPWPSAFAKIKNKNLKIIEAENNILKINKHKIGELFLDNNKLAIQCGQDALIIKKLQLEGKKEMVTEEFLRGHKDLIGMLLQ
jgi:methionyl-tRNA formyltransferase